MAISDYDTFVLSTQDASTRRGDDLITPRGLRVSVYKTWAYVRSASMWREGGGYSEDTIAEIRSGEVRIDDLTIKAVRGPQDGVYVVAFTPYEFRPEDAMVGCGMYGYDGDDPVGVQPESVAFLREFAETHLESDHPLLSDEHWSRASG